MTDNAVPDPPEGTKAAGKRLWESILGEYELEQHELQLLTEMVRTTDLLDELDSIVRREGIMVGDKMHPALVESRQQKIVLARLAAALRLPAGNEGDQQRGARRPQRRSTRGVYGMAMTA